MEYKDYYKILGVDKSVGKTELKSRYRKLARQYHPDVNTTDKDAASRFAEISEAYAVLSDDEKRKKYDALGSDWEQYQAAGKEDNFDWSKYASPRNGREQTSEQNWGEFFGSGAGADASEFFRNIFGQAFGGRSTANFARKGPDLHALRLRVERPRSRPQQQLLGAGRRERGPGSPGGPLRGHRGLLLRQSRRVFDGNPHEGDR